MQVVKPMSASNQRQNGGEHGNDLTHSSVSLCDTSGHATEKTSGSRADTHVKDGRLYFGSGEDEDGSFC